VLSENSSELDPVCSDAQCAGGGKVNQSEQISFESETM
jgi:hypothetical protein